MITIAIILSLVFIFHKSIAKILKFLVSIAATVFFVLVLCKAFTKTEFYAEMRDLHADMPEEEAIIESSKDIVKGTYEVGKLFLTEEFERLTEVGAETLNESLK